MKHFQITFQTSRILYHRIMGLFLRLCGILSMFCVYCFVNGGPLFSDETLNMDYSFTKDLPLSMQSLLDKFMESVDAIDSDENSDISFHSLENVNGVYELDIREILADHDVTGVDLMMTSSKPSSCRFVWVENDIKLDGRRINEYVFFNIDHLLAMEHSSMLSTIRIVPSSDCFRQHEPTYSFSVIYRNLTKDKVYNELDNMGISRFKRDTTKMDPKNDTCNVVPWTVDFARLGWDRYISYPLTYNANACEGKCVQTRNCDNAINKPISMLKNYEVVRRLYAYFPDVSLPDHSCCRPSKYGSQGIVFRGEPGSLFFIVVSQMRVLECSSN